MSFDELSMFKVLMQPSFLSCYDASFI